jgi:hypothetical protein
MVLEYFFLFLMECTFLAEYFTKRILISVIFLGKGLFFNVLKLTLAQK